MADKPRTMKLRRLQGSGHRSIATNVTVFGPTSDQLFHMHFYYDAVNVLADTGDILQSDGTALAMTNLTTRDDDREYVRVEVAVISIPLERLPGFANVLSGQVAELEKRGILKARSAER